MGRVRLERRGRDGERPRTQPAASPAPAVLALQASAGNRAVAQMLQRAVFAPAKKKQKVRLTKRAAVVDAVFEQIGKKQSEQLETLLGDPDAAIALDEFLADDTEEITLASERDADRLIQRIAADAEKVRGRRQAKEKQKEKEKEPKVSSGKLEKQTEPAEPIAEPTHHGSVTALFALCEPLYKQNASAAQQKKKAIETELEQLKRSLKTLNRLACLEMMGHLGNLEISEVCGRAGLTPKLKQLETALRRAIEGDDDTADEFMWEQLHRILTWLSFEQFMAIYAERSGSHGASGTSARITPIRLMQKYGEIMACAQQIDAINLSGTICLSALGMPCTPNLLGFTLLHKVAAGNIRRFKMATIERCVKRLVVLCPLALTHPRVTGTAQKGIRASVQKVVTEMNSKHLLRDVRQLEMLLAYLGMDPEASCAKYAFSGTGWEFDMLMTGPGGSFVLEVEGLPASSKDPQSIVTYLEKRHAIKQAEAENALGAETKVRLAVPADLPAQALAALDGRIAIAGAPKADSGGAPEAAAEEDDDDEGEV